MGLQERDSGSSFEDIAIDMSPAVTKSVRLEFNEVRTRTVATHAQRMHKRPLVIMHRCRLIIWFWLCM